MSTKEQPISNLGLSGFIAQRVTRKDGSNRCTLRCKPKGSDKFIPAGKIDEGEFGVVIFRDEFIERFPQLKGVTVIRKPDRSYVYLSADDQVSVESPSTPDQPQVQTAKPQTQPDQPQAQPAKTKAKPKEQASATPLQPGEHPIAELDLPSFIAQRTKRADGTYRCSLRYKLKGSTKCPSVGKVAGDDEFGPILFNDSFLALYPQLKELTVLRTSDRGYVYLEGATQLPKSAATKAPAAQGSALKPAASKATTTHAATVKKATAKGTETSADQKAAKQAADKKATAAQSAAEATAVTKTTATKTAAKKDVAQTTDTETAAPQAAESPAAAQPKVQTDTQPKAQAEAQAQAKPAAAHGALTLEALRAQSGNGGLYGAANPNLPGFWLNCPGEPSENDVTAILGRSTAELGQLLAQFTPQQAEQFFLEQIKTKQHDPKRRLFLLSVDLNHLPEAPNATAHQAAQPYLFLAEDQWAAPRYIGAPHGDVSTITGLCDEAERLYELVQATRNTPEPDDSDAQRALRPVLLLGANLSGKAALTYSADANFDVITQFDPKSAVGASALDMAARFNIVSAQNRIATNPNWHHLALPPATDIELEGEDDTILVHLHVLLNNQGYEAAVQSYTQMAQSFIEHVSAGIAPDASDLQCQKLKLVTLNVKGEQKSYQLNSKNIEQQALAQNLMVLGTTITNIAGSELVRGAQVLSDYPKSLTAWAQQAKLTFAGESGPRLILAWALNTIFLNEFQTLHP